MARAAVTLGTLELVTGPYVAVHEAPPVAGARRDVVLPFVGKAPRLVGVRAGPGPDAQDNSPPLGGVEAPERIPAPPSRTVGFAIFLSLLLHVTLIAWSMHAHFEEQAIADRGNGEEIIVDGISVILLDSVPTVPKEPELAEAKPVEASQVAALVADAEPAAAAGADVAADSESEQAVPAADETRAAIAEDVAAARAEDEGAPAEVQQTASGEVQEAKEVAAAEFAVAPVSDAPTAPATESAPLQPAPDANEATIAQASPVEILAQDLPEDAAAPTTLDIESTATEQVETSVAEASNADTELKPVDPKEEQVAVLTATDAPADALPAPAKEQPREPAAKVQKASIATVAEKPARGPNPDKAGAGGQSSTEGGRVNASSYRAQLAAHLRRYRSYPEAARESGISGTARVSFTVNARGQVTGARLTASSGHRLLDQAAVGMVRRASPFPPIPTQVGISVLTVDVPVRFDGR